MNSAKESTGWYKREDKSGGRKKGVWQEMTVHRVSTNYLQPQSSTGVEDRERWERVQDPIKN